MRKLITWIVAVVIGVPIIALAAFAFILYLSDPGPPTIFRTVHCNENDWRGNSCNMAFDKIVRQEFPVGTPMEKLKAVLSEQGFKLEDYKIAHCTNPGDPVKIGVEMINCPSWDRNWNPKNALVYHWGKPPCGQTAFVEWSADKNAKISHIEGSYYYTCL